VKTLSAISRIKSRNGFGIPFANSFSMVIYRTTRAKNRRGLGSNAKRAKKEDKSE
jgi:hypothetical protein